MQYRQGDVLITRVDEVKVKPKDKVKSKHGRLILAEGEATGHHHSVPASSGKLYAIAGGMLAMILNRKTTLMHQEHDSIPLPKGTYVIQRQREMNTDQLIVPVRD